MAGDRDPRLRSEFYSSDPDYRQHISDTYVSPHPTKRPAVDEIIFRPNGLIRPTTDYDRDWPPLHSGASLTPNKRWRPQLPPIQLPLPAFAADYRKTPAEHRVPPNSPMASTDAAESGEKKSSLNRKILFHITRPRDGYIHIKQCVNCRSNTYKDFNRFIVDEDDETVICRITLCKKCAINNICDSMQFWNEKKPWDRGQNHGADHRTADQRGQNWGVDHQHLEQHGRQLRGQRW
jgi:hypothetical protein